MSAEQTTPLAEVRIGRATPREDDAISELQEFLGELAAQASVLVGGAAALAGYVQQQAGGGQWPHETQSQHG